MNSIITDGLISVFVLVGIVFACLFIPTLFWKCAPFKDIKALSVAIGAESTTLKFSGHIHSFKYASPNTGRTALFIYISSTEQWLDNHVTELSNVLLLATIGQGILLFIRMTTGLGTHAEGGILSLIHVPFAEVAFGLFMIYLFVRLGQEWKRAKALFPEEAWQTHP